MQYFFRKSFAFPLLFYILHELFCTFLSIARIPMPKDDKIEVEGKVLKALP